MTNPKPPIPQVPTAITAVAIYTVLMAILWLTSLLHVSFFWVIAPAAYLVHLGIHAGMLHRAVEVEIEKAFNQMEDFLPEDVVLTQFHDATQYEGSLQ